MDTEKINAEVISVFPNKIKIAVEDLENFQIAEEKLKVGSYLRISDNENAILIAIIENFSIEIGKDSTETPVRKYILEANPLGIIRDGKFERGDDSLAIPPKQVEPAKTEEIEKIFIESIDENEKFTFASLSTNPAISVPVNGNKFFNKHIAIVGSTGSGKSHSIAKILQEAIHCKNGEYTGLNNSHIVIFDIHSEYKSAFPTANYIDISTLVDRGILAKPEFRLLIPNIPYDYSHKFAYYDKPTYASVYRDCIVGNIARNEMIAWQAKKLLAEGRQVYIHVSQIDHGEILNSMIPVSVVVFGTTKERRQIIEDYTNGKIRCLISTLLKEGVNIPSIDGLIYAAGGKSEISTIQTIGRAMRKKDDGRNAIVIDIHDTVDCYLSEHSQQREMTYIKVYGKLYNPTYIKQLEMEDELGMKINV